MHGKKNQGVRAETLMEKGGCHPSLSEQVEVEGWAGLGGFCQEMSQVLGLGTRIKFPLIWEFSGKPDRDDKCEPHTLSILLQVHLAFRQGGINITSLFWRTHARVRVEGKGKE